MTTLADTAGPGPTVGNASDGAVVGATGRGWSADSASSVLSILLVATAGICGLCKLLPVAGPSGPDSSRIRAELAHQRVIAKEEEADGQLERRSHCKIA
ncbi:hypothetical protein CDL15_Pgr025954 [Punica granatum]|uniref:Uncharacterized protein n=1 Tax=Punica granatum TaxID=22663 RepID=A0A218WB56_PUNGR|nr:hypothetical protein CDL15_Pgr025954 [Punica granatum]